MRNMEAARFRPQGKPTAGSIQGMAAFAELERGVQKALETYANVHRGSGPHSLVTTALFEQARGIVLNYLGINDGRHVVVFCTPRSGMRLREKIAPGGCRVLSSEELGLPIGVRALAVERKALPKGPPIQTGGGVVRIVSPNSVVWAGAPKNSKPALRPSSMSLPSPNRSRSCAPSEPVFSGRKANPR